MGSGTFAVEEEGIWEGVHCAGSGVAREAAYKLIRQCLAGT